MYPIQVSTLLIWFKVRIFVRESDYSGIGSLSDLVHAGSRTVHVQVIYSDFVVFLEDLIYK